MRQVARTKPTPARSRATSFSLTCTSGIISTAVLYTGKSQGAALMFFLSFPKKHIMESPFYRFWEYTVFVATAFMSNPLMVTLPSDNCGPSC